MSKKSSIFAPALPIKVRFIKVYYMDQPVKYLEIADMLCCSLMTARRKIKVMRRELGLPKYSRLRKSQVTDYFFHGTKQ